MPDTLECLVLDEAQEADFIRVVSDHWGRGTRDLGWHSTLEDALNDTLIAGAPNQMMARNTANPGAERLRWEPTPEFYFDPVGGTVTRATHRQGVHSWFTNMLTVSSADIQNHLYKVGVSPLHLMVTAAADREGVPLLVGAMFTQYADPVDAERMFAWHEEEWQQVALCSYGTGIFEAGQRFSRELERMQLDAICNQLRDAVEMCGEHDGVDADDELRNLFIESTCTIADAVMIARRVAADHGADDLQIVY